MIPIEGTSTPGPEDDSDAASDEQAAEEAAATWSSPHALTEGQMEEVISSLRSGQRLPPHLFPHLFQAPKEHELAYAGKARRADVLADTMAVPLQPVRTFGSAEDDGWSNMLVFGDNLQVLRRLVDMKRAGLLRNADGTDGVRLCYIDPPFATRRDFQGAKGERAYQDRVGGAEFIEFLRRRLILIHELLADDGALYVHLDGKKVHYIKVVLDEVSGESNFRNEIIWHYKFRLMQSSRIFNRKHDNILFYAKSSRTTLRRVAEEWTRESIIATRKQAIYEDEGGEWIWMPGGKGHSKNKKKYLSEIVQEGKALSDVWDLPILNSGAKEDTGFPTQKPEALIERIVTASSSPGDLVLDCFLGSGSTVAVAAGMPDGSRRWIGVDVGKYAIYVAQARLMRQELTDGEPNAFTLFNAGLYDYRTLRALSWEEYRAFVLTLFQCRPKKFAIGGVYFDGRMSRHPVLVYDFNASPGAKVGVPFLEDLVRLCGPALGERCFIIAPALQVEPYEDYIDIGDTRFFFLRIPYSVIAELHRRAFSELRQAQSPDTLNALIDSVGFDFIQPPRVQAEYQRHGKDGVVQITEFESEAYAATTTTSSMDDLAMVLVDLSYDGDIFDVDLVAYDEDLRKANYGIRVPLKKASGSLMLVFIDVYGNELRQVVSVADFGTHE